MVYSEDVNVNMNVVAGTMGGVTAITSGMSALTSSFGAIGSEAASTFGTLDGLIVTATALIGTFAFKSAEAFGEYEQGMKIVQTVSGQTGSAMNELTTKANEMSVAYRTSINDITDGLQTLGRAGLNSASEQLDVLESGLQTAKLEGRSLNGVLEELIQNTAMLGGDLKSVNFGEQSEYVNSLLVGTSMTAPIDSHDISQTLQYAGGTAAAAGANIESEEGKKKLEDLMGTVAAFAQKGVTGSMAGTALRSFFTKPASQDQSVTDGLAMIGLTPDSLWEDGGESMKSVSDQIGIIQRQMESLNMSTMDQIEVWGKIVGPKMGQQMMKLDSSTIKDLTRDIESAQSAEALATQTLHTYTQKLSEMGQQADVVNREFGEKAAMWLAPAVEAVTWILKALSNPAINTVAFAAVGATLAHGVRKAYAMIQTVYNQLRGLFSETISGIESINTLAGGSASGFSQSVSQVEFLNSKLAQTNAELAAMQAKYLKFGVSGTGTSVMPLGIVGPNGKIPRNMINYEDQNVLRMGGVSGQGRFYDPRESDQFKQDFQRQIQKETDDKIAAEMKKREVAGPYGSVRYRGEDGKFIGKENLKKELTEKFSPSQDEINKRTAAALKSGSGQIHSSLMSMTSKEYKTFMQDLNAASSRLADQTNYLKGGLYVDKHGNYTEKYHQDQLKDFNRNRQLEYLRNARQEGNVHRNVVNGQTFMRGFKLDIPKERMFEVERTMQKQAQLNAFEKQRSNVINQQQALAQGRGQGLLNRAQQVGAQRMRAYANVVSGLSNRTRSAMMSMQRFSGQLDLQGPKVQTAVQSAMTSIDAGTMTFEQALVQISETTGLQGAELAQVFMTVSEASGVTATELTVLGEKFAALGLVTAEGEAVTASNTGALIQNTLAEEANTGSKMGGAMGALSSVVGFMGGPLMLGMMGITAGIQAVQASQQAWQEAMQEATEQVSEAMDSLSQSEENIKQLYSSENNSMTEADLTKAVDQQYASVYDSFYAGEEDRASLGVTEFESDLDMRGTTNEETGEYSSLSAEEVEARNAEVDAITLSKDENVQALRENTMQLVAATAAYNQAQNRQVEQFNNPSWGFDSFTADVTDQLGEWQEEIWNTGAWLWEYDNRAGFLDSHAPVLTGSQADSNYAGSTEFAGIFAANVKRFDDENREIDDPDRYLKSLQQFFGSDYDRIISLMGSMDGKMSTIYGQNLSGKDALYTHAQNMAGMSYDEMSTAQMSMKNNPELYQQLGKQMFRYEQSQGFKSGRTAYGDYGTISKASRAKTPKEQKQALKDLGKIGKKKLTVQDKNLLNTMKKAMAMTDNKLSEQNLLAMGQLQQLQDMYTVANETVAPGIMQTVQGVYDNVNTTGQAASAAGGAESGAVSAANNAAAIAAFLGAEAQSTAEKAAFQKYNRAGGKYGTQEEFVAAVARGELPQYEREILKSLEGTSWSLMNGDNDPAHVKQNSERLYGELDKMGGDYQSKLDTATWGILQYAQKSTMAAYDQSTLGEYGSGSRSSGTGSGGGSGSGSGSDNKNTGNVKNRVDLVLCNKKTIPKLNVNLFKKAPNFTVLNKNFKVRDIKINTQDKPKAMMNALKNGIIDVQRRTDPKIIQDDEAVYDPTAATDGDNLPQGSTQTTT